MTFHRLKRQPSSNPCAAEPECKSWHKVTISSDLDMAWGGHHPPGQISGFTRAFDSKKASLLLSYLRKYFLMWWDILGYFGINDDHWWSLEFQTTQRRQRHSTYKLSHLRPQIEQIKVLTVNPWFLGTVVVRGQGRDDKDIKNTKPEWYVSGRYQYLQLLSIALAHVWQKLVRV